MGTRFLDHPGHDTQLKHAEWMHQEGITSPKQFDRLPRGRFQISPHHVDEYRHTGKDTPPHIYDYMKRNYADTRKVLHTKSHHIYQEGPTGGWKNDYGHRFETQAQPKKKRPPIKIREKGDYSEMDEAVFMKPVPQHGYLPFGDLSRKNKEHNRRTAKWDLHHSDYGHIGRVEIESTHKNDEPSQQGAFKQPYEDMHPLHKAKSVSMSIHSWPNEKVPASEIHKDTAMGPQYKLGVGATRDIFRHIKNQYPSIEKIENSPRVTGARTNLDNKNPAKRPTYRMDKGLGHKPSGQQSFKFD